jgi:archaemetzincin
VRFGAHVAAAYYAQDAGAFQRRSVWMRAREAMLAHGARFAQMPEEEGPAMQFLPKETERISAAGPMRDIPDALRRALEPDGWFEPLPEPGPNDWLANHPEKGQTFDDYIACGLHVREARRRRLYLQPLGRDDTVNGTLLMDLTAFASAFFMTEVVAPPPLDVARARIRRRNNPFSGQLQLCTVDILNLLRMRLPADAFAVLGLTVTDLYPDPNWNFVFGQASPRERVGVYSFARYDPAFYGEAAGEGNSRIILRRSANVLAHETGHMLGISHCVWYRCLMNGSNHLQEADARPLHLCPVDLRKLQWAMGFDVVERYRRLREFHKAAGFEDEAAWVDARLRAIGAG